MDDDEYLEDLDYEEAEGAAEFEFDEDDDFEDEFELGAEDEFEDEDYYDGLEEVDDEDDDLEFGEFEDDYEDGFEDDDIEEDLAYALGAEDTDEFWGRLKKLYRKVKKVARKAAPILSSIPHPWAQGAGRAAAVISRLPAEGASEEEGLDAMAEAAVKDRRARPLVVGIAARTLVKRKGAQMSRTQRKRVVRTMNKAAKTLVRKRGPKAIRALAKITKSVKRTTAAKGTPTTVAPKIVLRTAAKVARSPALTRRLCKPSRRGRRFIKRPTMRRAIRSYMMSGPTRITISRV